MGVDMAPTLTLKPVAAIKAGPRNQRGSSLIEVLIAFLLLSVGMMGMAAMHGRAIQYSVDGQDRTRAALLASEMVSLMWAKRSNAPSNTDIAAWQSKVTSATASGLPNASGTVSTPDANGIVTITITWRPPNRSSSEGNFKYVTRAALP
jgi:type IV pilus assembly protein PilV